MRCRTGSCCSGGQARRRLTSVTQQLIIAQPRWLLGADCAGHYDAGPSHNRPTGDRFARSYRKSQFHGPADCVGCGANGVAGGANGVAGGANGIAGGANGIAGGVK